MTLKLTFSDGQPMTYGSACAGERTTIVLPRLLAGSAPAVDAVESDMAARINDARAVRGLAPAAVNVRLSAAADLHATWLDSGNVDLPLPILSHEGPFGSTVAFRLGEVSFPEPAAGAEIVAAGMTPAHALAGWLTSAGHRDLVLAPGPQLVGVANVGRVIVVDTHPPCAGCQPPAAAPTGGGARAPTAAAGAAPAGPPGASGAAGGTGGAGGAHPSSSSSCGREQVGVRRMRARPWHLRLRVTCAACSPAPATG